MHSFTNFVAAAAAVGGAAAQEFNILQHVGGNGQWFPGPEVTGISSDVPAGCKVELSAFFSRHGSRYPDTGAYNGWVELSERLQAASLDVTDDKFAFLKTWKPVLSDPDNQIAQISPTGVKELRAMGATWRERYPDLYQAETPFTMWVNYYKSSPRVRDSGRYFAQGFVGPNASNLTTIYALNASDPAAWQNSLAPSDLCKAYNDEGGSPYKEIWDDIWIPSVQARLNAIVKGFNFTAGDVQQIPYLCGFETQITESRSPFCDLLTEEEVLGYEYSQDLRYWYGTGLGSDIEKYQMLPVLDMVAQRFVDGPNAIYQNGNKTFVPPKVMANFANDGQINQLIAMLGVFDDEPQLPGDRSPADRLFRSSRLTPMRGTVAFERLSCPAEPVESSCGGYGNVDAKDTYMRILLNDVVYPVVGCTDGPGSSCPLLEYQNIVREKFTEAGSFAKLCNDTTPLAAQTRSANFFMDPEVPFATIVRP